MILGFHAHIKESRSREISELSLPGPLPNLLLSKQMGVFAQRLERIAME